MLSLSLFSGLMGNLSWGQSNQYPKSSIGLLGSGGYVIEAIEKGKGGEKVGLRMGETILDVNGRGFFSLNEFKTLFVADKVNEVRILHVGKGELRSRKLKLQDVDSYHSLGITGTLGYVVQKVHPDSPASQAGFQPGDAILEVNGKLFSSLEDFSELLVMSEPGTQLVLKVHRKDESGVHRYNLSIKTVPFSSVKRQ